VDGAGHAIVLEDSLSGDVGTASPQLAREGRLNQRDEAGYSLRFVAGDLHSAVCALDEPASTLSSLATPSGFPLLTHLFAQLMARSSRVRLNIVPLDDCSRHSVSSGEVDYLVGLLPAPDAVREDLFVL